MGKFVISHFFGTNLSFHFKLGVANKNIHLKEKKGQSYLKLGVAIIFTCQVWIVSRYVYKTIYVGQP